MFWRRKTIGMGKTSAVSTSCQGWTDWPREEWTRFPPSALGRTHSGSPTFLQTDCASFQTVSKCSAQHDKQWGLWVFAKNVSVGDDSKALPDTSPGSIQGYIQGSVWLSTSCVCSGDGKVRAPYLPREQSTDPDPGPSGSEFPWLLEVTPRTEHVGLEGDLMWPIQTSPLSWSLIPLGQSHSAPPPNKPCLPCQEHVSPLRPFPENYPPAPHKRGCTHTLPTTPTPGLGGPRTPLASAHHLVKQNVKCIGERTYDIKDFICRNVGKQGRTIGYTFIKFLFLYQEEGEILHLFT